MMKLYNGVEIPANGFGVYQVSKEDCKESVLTALKTGYRHIDTAQSYFNEEEVGAALKESDVPRNEIFLTTKVWIDNYGEGKAYDSVIESLKKLAKNSLSIGGMVFLIATNRIDYNAMLDFNNLPHKFAKIADYAKNIDMNKVAIGIESIKKIGDFIKTRKEEKVQNNLQGVNFKTILHKTGEKMKKSEFPTLTKLKNIDKQMQISNLEITHDNGLIAQDER